MRQILETFDRLRHQGGDHSPWTAANRDAVINALRWTVPEMVTAVAG
jgi:hypothetical protein